MMTASEESIKRLLEETLAAHSVYETTVLGGVYDEDWSDWYAAYLLKHGLPGLLPHHNAISAARLGAILKQLDAGFLRERPEGEWPAYYAKRLSAALE